CSNGAASAARFSIAPNRPGSKIAMVVASRSLVLLAFLVGACGSGGGENQRDGATADTASTIDAPRIDDGGIDAAMTTDARPCTGTTHTIVDNFDDNMRNTTLWGNAYADSVSTYAETAGHVVITLGVNATDNWAGYMTSNGYELADDRVFVMVPQ